MTYINQVLIIPFNMKIIVFLFALAAANAEIRLGFPGKTRGLNDDLATIVELIPTDEIIAAISRFSAGDEEVQYMLRYLQGPEWGALVAGVAGNPSWINFKNFCLENGVNVDDIVGNIHDLIGGATPGDGGNLGGLRALIDEIKELIPFDALIAQIDVLLNESESFRAFYAFISSNTAREFLNEILAIDEVQEIIAFLETAGIDVEYIIEFIKEFLGWSRVYFPEVPLEYV
ncbi:protein G12-like [Onthophagus taurus]|uniref:protein G12-like n=1 Tax=Onthophagus taurus TaxID=166361 RepID=UPI0039BE9740